MHDQALMVDLLEKIEQVTRAEGASAVRTIRVSLGALSHMTPEHFREHFADIAPGTLAAGARIEAVCETDTTADDAGGIRIVSLEVEYPD